VQLQFRRSRLHEVKHTGIGDNNAIGLNFTNGIDIFGQFRDVAVMGEEIEREIGAPAACAGEGDAFQHFLKR